jgi:hypothetical protein
MKKKSQSDDEDIDGGGDIEELVDTEEEEGEEETRGSYVLPADVDTVFEKDFDQLPLRMQVRH